jgi:hypothetical protein
MAFTGNGYKITSTLFYLQRIGSSSTAKFEVRIYEKPAGTNTWYPLSNVLAVSEQKVLNDIPTTMGWVSFTFTGTNQFKTVAGTTYMVTLLCTSAGLSNSYSTSPRLDIRLSNTVLTRRYVDYFGGNWETGTNFSYLFQVLGESASAYSVTYNGNGNTGGSAPTDSNSPYQSGVAVTVLSQGTLTKTNSTFLGWATSNSATAPTYVQGSTFTISATTTLYAVWSSSGGSGNWDGGKVNNPISINDDWLNLYYYQNDVPNPQNPNRLDWSVKAWMYQYSKYPRQLPPGADENDNIGLRLIDKTALMAGSLTFSAQLYEKNQKASVL